MALDTIRRLVAAALTAAALSLAPGAHAGLVCDGPAGDPAVGTLEWTVRDLENVVCGHQRFFDAAASPAFHAKLLQQTVIEAKEFFTATLFEWLAEPTRLHGGGTLSQEKVCDPFRNYEEWAAAGRGRHLKFYFINRDGAKLRARVLAPLDQSRTYPALTFTPGLQSYNEVNAWFPQEMAEAGYVVLIIDPQGQGESELCGHAPDGTLTTCPFTNQPNDTRSAIDFVLSTPANPYPWALGKNAAGTPTYNPFWQAIDRAVPVGITGHSLGAQAVTSVGQQDSRVGAIASYDNLDAALGAGDPRRTPTLFVAADYGFPLTPLPMFTNPDPDGHLTGLAYDQLAAAGVDVMSITPRASDHYEWGFQPFPASFPSSRYGERVSLYYTLAWFDRYLKGDPDGTARVLRGTFDDTADLHSIGTGTYDPVRALRNFADPFAGNVPYRIAGKCVANLLSIYYHSAYRLEDGLFETGDMRALGCEDGDEF